MVWSSEDYGHRWCWPRLHSSSSRGSLAAQGSRHPPAARISRVLVSAVTTRSLCVPQIRVSLPAHVRGVVSVFFFFSSLLLTVAVVCVHPPSRAVGGAKMATDLLRTDGDE